MNIQKSLKYLIGQSEDSGFFNEVTALDKQLDSFFDINRDESKVLNQSSDVYAGLTMEALSTSYLDYYKVLNDLGAQKSLLDVGSGYCRGTFLANELGFKCQSIELDEHRASFAKKRYPNQVFIQNILKKEIFVSDAYFLYIPWSSISNEVLRFIYEKNIECILYVIESHGDFISNMNLYKNFHLVEDSLTTSNKRHLNKIFKYKFKPSNEFQSIRADDYKKSESFPLWFLKYAHNVKSLYIDTNSVDGKKLKWSSPLVGSYCCYYNGRRSLYLKAKSRYLQYHFDTIIGVEV